MNVFEDLLDELKEENLLEETVIENQEADDDEYLNELTGGAAALQNDTQSQKNELPKIETLVSTENTVENNVLANQPGELLIVGNDEFTQANSTVQNFPFAQTSENKPVFDEKEFYRKRATEEVSGLQMVEHVLSGVEREQMKASPQNYDDISAKKALHDFLQIAADVDSPEHAQAEFQLMQETEMWCSALSHRDKRISVAHLRRYCETTRPPLSSQALISLARFYRNLPFSESVRGKFDFVVTKLFSKDDGHEKRVLVFSREELIRHFKELYAEWSSVSLYSADDDDSDIVLAELKFEDFMTECESAADFDELVRTDFFNRLRLFKESTNEVFFAPLVTAAAIECNARIGNRYVDLIQAERKKNNAEDLQDKYGFMHDQAISDATSKTLQLIDLLKEKNATQNRVKVEKPKLRVAESAGEKVKEKTIQEPASKKETIIEENRRFDKFEKKTDGKFPAVSKSLLAATIFVIISSIALYVYVYQIAVPADVSTNVKKVNLDNSSLQEFLKTARISGETFYGITLLEWQSMTTEKKEEALKKIFSMGADKGYTKVHLINKDGKTVGYASAEKVEVIAP
jgi:hypothetical protein